MNWLYKKNFLLLCIISFGTFATVFANEEYLLSEIDVIPKQKRNVALGIGLLSAAYTIGPAVAYTSWWKAGFKLDNPLKYIGEREPYLEDNAWHITGTIMIAELHYRILHNCFRSKHAALWATSLTLFDFTIVECLDALEKSGKWEFSLGDQVANIFGVGFWLFKHHYPNAPVDFRVGIRKWGEVKDLCSEAFTALRNFEEFEAHEWDHYSILKVEGIYRFDHGFYCGVALSKKDAPSEEDLWGITAGWDLVRGLKKMGYRNSFLETVSEYVSVPITFTFWLE